MTRPELLPANLPTLPTAQMLARLSAEPGRCEMTVDPASPWVAGVIVRTPRLLLALHAVNAGEAQIIAAPRLPGLQGSGDQQLQSLLASAAPTSDAAYRPVPPPALDEAAPPPLERPVLQAAEGHRRPDLPLIVVWGLLAFLSLTGAGGWLPMLTALVGITGVILGLLGLPERGAGRSPALRSLNLVAGIAGILAILLAVNSAVAPLVAVLALVSVAAGTASRAGRASGVGESVQVQQSLAEESSPQALPAPQLQLIETTRARLQEYLEVAERSGNPRDAFEARQALEVHLPEVVDRWEALPSWRRRDDAPLRRTLEQLSKASLPDTTTSELQWDATERFIEQKARAKAGSGEGFTVGREPSPPRERTRDMDKLDATEESR